MLRKAFAAVLVLGLAAMSMGGCFDNWEAGWRCEVWGVVYDQVTGNRLSGAEVSWGDNYTYTDENGAYSLEVTEGARVISCRKSGYVDSKEKINVSDPILGTHYDPKMIPILSSGYIKAELTWGLQPPDLDAHMWTPRGGHVYFGSTYDSGVELDGDVRNGYGPETITISSLASGKYSYSVNNHSVSPPLRGCGATVTIYVGGSRRYTATVPDVGYEGNTWWNVFEIDGDTRGLRRLNTLSQSPEFSARDAFGGDEFITSDQ